MTSWYSNILTKTTSQISSLRSTLLSSEADGDTEDDTHVCRVLRNYYTDKGRPLPGWLPPDPKAAAQVPQTLYAQPQVGSRYGGLGPQGQQAGAGGGALSSLWDSGPAQQPPQAGSLRAGRQGVGGGGMAPQRGGPGGGGAMDRDAVLPRPLPSQREGSYQNAMGGSGQPPSQGGGGASAQDRLRQRLWGAGRTASPSQGQSGFQPPPANSVGGPGGGGGGGGGSYEDRFAPGGQYSGGGGGGGGGYGQSQGQGQRRQGLPSGPRGYR